MRLGESSRIRGARLRSGWPAATNAATRVRKDPSVIGGCSAARRYIALCDGRDPDLSDLVPGLNAAVERYAAEWKACPSILILLCA